MKRLSLLVGIVLAASAFAGSAQAQGGGNVQLTQRGCAVAADMTLVARSLALEGVARALAARIMAQVYVAYAAAGGEAEVAKLREAVLALGYSRTEKPLELARIVGEACLRSDGDGDAMFGSRIRWSY